jgi:tRNA G18 (ribose-2'-O)-methylase SpoU
MSNEIPNTINTESQSPKSFILLSNIQSGSNIGSICRNALAFNVSEVVIVGRKDLKMRQADRGARNRLAIKYFPILADAAVYLKEEHQCIVAGIEICEDAASVMTYPFQMNRNYAFMFGNEGGGLSPKQRALCEAFLYIPQYAPEGMASINVACASAIILQRYAFLADYPETIRKGEKFI